MAGVPPVAALGGPAPVHDLPLVAILPPPPGCPVNPQYVAPSATVAATVNPRNRQLVWQLMRFEGRLNPGELNTRFHAAIIRARNSARNSASLVHLGNFWNLIWVNRSRKGAYILHIVRHILNTYLRANQPPCMRQMPHAHPGKVTSLLTASAVNSHILAGYCGHCYPPPAPIAAPHEHDSDDESNHREDANFEDLYSLVMSGAAHTYTDPLTGREADISMDFRAEMKESSGERYRAVAAELQLNLSPSQKKCLHQMHQRRV